MKEHLKPIPDRLCQRTLLAWTRRPVPRACLAGIAAAAVATVLQACAPGDGSNNVAANAAAKPAAAVADDTACADMLEHEAWTGTVAYRQARNTRSDGDHHVAYDMDIALGAELAERTRRQHRGADYLVQYYSPLPEGTANLRYTLESHDHAGLARSVEFTGNGRMQRQEPDMTENGSTLSLTLNAHDCTYQFHLQGQVFGSGESWDRHDGTEPYPGPVSILSVNGMGSLTPGTSLRGSAPFPVLSRSRIEDNQFEKTRWVGEMDAVARALGEDNLGTVIVEWNFTPKD